MILTTTIGAKLYQVDTNRPIDISIPLVFNGEQPNHFGVNPAAAQALEADGFIGDTRRGGGCNVETYTLTPHCNGTHTECAGHILNERIAVSQTLQSCFFPAVLITVQPVNAFDSADEYQPEKEKNDQLITRKTLQNALQHIPGDFLRGLIIRTLPNDASKKSRNYRDFPPPFFSLEAMRFISELPVAHLLVDVPSVDRIFDEGRLNVHHIFWNVPAGSHEKHPHTRLDKTITEMIYVPSDIPDGYYLANIQIPNFITDAAPSRVFLYSIDNG